ncbi:hypothetical protein U0070_003038 [Myodes glareolus]|uniref:Uncharacterized protein n=1 Tax=Myodes glareolus TaxID=447135 RepID=A0AAW0I0N0_MYOGA
MGRVLFFPSSTPLPPVDLNKFLSLFLNTQTPILLPFQVPTRSLGLGHYSLSLLVSYLNHLE